MLELLKSQLELLEEFTKRSLNYINHSEYITYLELKFDLEQKIKEIENNE